MKEISIQVIYTDRARKAIDMITNLCRTDKENVKVTTQMTYKTRGQLQASHLQITEKLENRQQHKIEEQKQQLVW